MSDAIEVVQECSSPEEAARVFLAVYDRNQFKVVGNNICVKAHGYVPHVTVAYGEPGEPGPAPIEQPLTFQANTVSLVIGGKRTDYTMGNETKDVGTASPVGGPPLGFAPIQRGVGNEEEEEDEKPHEHGDIVLPNQRIPLEPRRVPRPQGKADAASGGTPVPSAPNDGRGDSSGVRSIPDERHHRLRLGAWENALANLLHQHFDRQERVVKAKLTGAKNRERWERAVAAKPETKEWNEADHPRGDDGKFGDGQGGSQHLNPRKSSRSSIDPFLPGIQERMSRFYADPANKIEILDKGADANKMVDMASVAKSKEDTWRAASPMPWTPAQLRLAGGLRYLKEQLNGMGHRYTAVATHDGEPVAAMGFGARMDDQLAVDALGSDQGTPGAGTALEVAVAKWGVDHDATGLASMATNDAVSFHQLIGRVVTGKDNKSTWSREDMDKIAALTPQAVKSLMVPLENDPDEAPMADFWENWRSGKSLESKEWNEADHPRGDDGKFGDGSGGSQQPVLAHYSAAPLGEIHSVPQEGEDYDLGKPSGLWFSVEGSSDDSWLKNEETEDPDKASTLTNRQELTLAPDANILSITSGPQLEAFTGQYSPDNGRHIDWAKVAQNHQGIIIAPYQAYHRSDPKTRWYATWDVPSGVIWDKDALLGSKKSLEAKREQPGTVTPVIVKPPVEVGHVFDKETWKDALKADTSGMVRAIWDDFGQDAADTYGVDWTIDTPDIDSAIGTQIAGLLHVEDTTEDQISKALEKGFHQGDDIQSLMERVGGVFDSARLLRAPMIAQQQTVAAGNGAIVNVGKQSDGEFTSKTWNTQGDEKVREWHNDADGQTVPIDAQFSVGPDMLDCPGDPAGSLENTINCRCWATLSPPTVTPWEPASAEERAAQDIMFGKSIPVFALSRSALRSPDVKVCLTRTVLNSKAKLTPVFRTSVKDDNPPSAPYGIPQNASVGQPVDDQLTEGGVPLEEKDWNPDAHPRDEHGKFISGAAVGGLVTGTGTKGKFTEDDLKPFIGRKLTITNSANDSQYSGILASISNPDDVAASKTNPMTLYVQMEGAGSVTWPDGTEETEPTMEALGHLPVGKDDMVHVEAEEPKVEDLTKTSLEDGSIKPTGKDGKYQASDLKDRVGEPLTFTNKDGDKITGKIFDAFEKNGHSYVEFAGNVGVDYADGTHEDDVDFGKLNLGNVREVMGKTIPQKMDEALQKLADATVGEVLNSKPEDEWPQEIADELSGKVPEGEKPLPTVANPKDADMAQFTGKEVTITQASSYGAGQTYTGTQEPDPDSDKNSPMHPQFQLMGGTGNGMYYTADELDSIGLAGAPSADDQLQSYQEQSAGAKPTTGQFIQATGAYGYTPADLEPFVGQKLTFTTTQGVGTATGTLSGADYDDNGHGVTTFEDVHWDYGTYPDGTPNTQDTEFVNMLTSDMENVRVTGAGYTGTRSVSGGIVLTGAQLDQDGLKPYVGKQVDVLDDEGSHIIGTLKYASNYGVFISDGVIHWGDGSEGTVAEYDGINRPYGEVQQVTVGSPEPTVMLAEEQPSAPRPTGGIVVKPTGIDPNNNKPVVTAGALKPYVGKTITMAWVNSSDGKTGTVVGKLTGVGNSQTNGAYMKFDDGGATVTYTDGSQGHESAWSTEGGDTVTVGEPEASPRPAGVTVVKPTGPGGKYLGSDLLQYEGQTVTIAGMSPSGTNYSYTGVLQDVTDGSHVVLQTASGGVITPYLPVGVTVTVAGEPEASKPTGTGYVLSAVKPISGDKYSSVDLNPLLNQAVKITTNYDNTYAGVLTAVTASGIATVFTGNPDDPYQDIAASKIDTLETTVPAGGKPSTGIAQPFGGGLPVTPTGEGAEYTPDHYTVGDLQGSVGKQVSFVSPTGATVTGTFSNLTADQYGDPQIDLDNVTVTEKGGISVNSFDKVGYNGNELGQFAVTPGQTGARPTGGKITATGKNGAYMASDLEPYKGQVVTVTSKDGYQWSTISGTVSGTMVTNGQNQYLKFSPDAAQTVVDVDGSVSTMPGKEGLGGINLNGVTSIEVAGAVGQPEEAKPIGALHMGQPTPADLKPLVGQKLVFASAKGGYYVGELTKVGTKFGYLKTLTGDKKVDLSEVTGVTSKITQDDLTPLIGKTITTTDAFGNTVTGKLDAITPGAGAMVVEGGVAVLKDVKGFGPNAGKNGVEKDELTVPIDKTLATVHEGISPAAVIGLQAAGLTLAQPVSGVIQKSGTNYSKADLQPHIGKDVMVTLKGSDTPLMGKLQEVVKGVAEPDQTYAWIVKQDGGEDSPALSDIGTVKLIGTPGTVDPYLQYLGGNNGAAAPVAVEIPQTQADLENYIGKTVTVTDKFKGGTKYTGTLAKMSTNPDGSLSEVSLADVTSKYPDADAEKHSATSMHDTLGGNNYGIMKIEAGDTLHGPGSVTTTPVAPKLTASQPTGKKLSWGSTIPATGANGLHSAEDLKPYEGHAVTATLTGGAKFTGLVSDITPQSNGGATFKVGNATWPTIQVAKLESGAQSDAMGYEASKDPKAGGNSYSTPTNSYEPPPPVKPDYDKTKPSATPEVQTDGVDRKSAAVAKAAGFATNVTAIKKELDGEGMQPAEAAQAARGRSLLYDGKDIEDLDVRVTKVTDGGKPAYELKFKMMPEAMDRLKEAINKPESNWGQGNLTIQRKDFDGKQFTVNPQSSYTQNHGRTAYGTVAGADVQVHYIPDQFKSYIDSEDTPYAYDRTVQVRIPADQFTNQKLNEVMSSLGVRSAGQAQKADVEVLANAKYDNLTHGSHGPDLAHKAGIYPGSIKITKGGGGRVEPRLSATDAKKLAETLGVKTFYHNWYSSDPQTMVDALASGTPNMSTTNRYAEGIGQSGMSSNTDIATGGADYVFTRQSSYSPKGGGGMKLVYDANKMLQRPDVHAYVSDSYGRTIGSAYAQRDTLKAIKDGAYDPGSQETMFKGRTSNDDLAAVYAGGSYNRDQIIKGLKERGITTLAGKPLEQMIHA